MAPCFALHIKAVLITRRLKNRVWVGADGEKRACPSEVAVKITGNSVNGWRFWQCQRPGDLGWQTIDRLRPRTTVVTEDIFARDA